MSAHDEPTLVTNDRLLTAVGVHIRGTFRNVRFVRKSDSPPRVRAGIDTGQEWLQCQLPEQNLLNSLVDAIRAELPKPFGLSWWMRVRNRTQTGTEEH